jgi:hypothetical protein
LKYVFPGLGVLIFLIGAGIMASGEGVIGAIAAAVGIAMVAAPVRIINKMIARREQQTDWALNQPRSCSC